MKPASHLLSNPLQEIELEHAPTVAVCAVKNCEVIPFKRADGKIAWLIRGNITDALKAIHENQTICIGDYLKQLSAVRSSIFTLKAMK